MDNVEIQVRINPADHWTSSMLGEGVMLSEDGELALDLRERECSCKLTSAQYLVRDIGGCSSTGHCMSRIDAFCQVELVENGQEIWPSLREKVWS
jgi:hypothetical protein